MTFEECLQRCGEEHAARLAESTLELYLKAVEQLVAFCGKPFDAITGRDIRMWLRELEQKGYRPNSMKSKLSGVKLFYRYCLEENHIKRNPAASIPYPTIEESLPFYLEEEQLDELRQLVAHDAQKRAIVELLYATGMRIGELVTMKKEDINWSERLIEIPDGKRKKGRIVLFTLTCAEHLKFYLETRKNDPPYVFADQLGRRPICKRTVQYWFKDYGKKLDIPLTPHTLRHTFAAHLARRGMPLTCIQILLGHDWEAQTQMYARLYNQARKEMYDQWM